MTPDGTTGLSELIHEPGTNNPRSSQPVLQSPPESGTTLADKVSYLLVENTEVTGRKCGEYGW